MIEAVFREERGRVLATLISVLGDVDLAEDALQEACAAALERWPRDGAPANPAGWLVAVARNRAIDRIRRDRTLAAKSRLLDGREPIEDEIKDTSFPDERLELIFTCAHPALAVEAQVALTLRALGGYFLLEADDLDAAIEIASKVPATRYGGAVEVRPLVQY